MKRITKINISKKQLRQTFLRELISIYESLPQYRINSSTIKKVYNEILSLTINELDCNAGTLFVVNKEDSSLNFVAVKGGDENLVGKLLKKGKGIVGRVAETGISYISQSASKDPFWMGEVSLNKAFSTKDILAYPIKYGTEVIGVVEVLNKKYGMFNKRDLNKLSRLTPHIAVLMKYLLDEVEKQRLLSMQIQLYELSKILNSNLETKSVVKEAMKAIVSLVNAEVGSLLLCDKEKKELFFEVALGDNEKTLKEIRLKFGQGIAGWVAQHKQPIIINDPSKDERFYKEADEKTGFITKNIVCVPVCSNDEVIGVMQALNKKEGLFSQEDLRLLTSLSDQVAVALDNASLHEELKNTFIGVVEALADAIEKRDPYTGGHTKRVVKYSLMIAEQINLDEDEKERLKMAALLHDVGKIGIDDSVLRKPEKLNDTEFEKMKQHPSIGANILGKIPQIKKIIPGILHHHEWYNGKGYPEGLSGGALPKIAKIISIADTYDAITTDRPYRKGLSHEWAIQEIKRFSGSQFDPEYVNAFIKAFEKQKEK